MEIIIHRRNTIQDLISTPSKYGVEIDIRSEKHNLIINHDPFTEGENFEEWIKHYTHGTLILNVKEEGLEEKLIEILNRHKISNFFFLDQSFPFLYKVSKSGESRIATRFSEYESIESVLALKNMVTWVWIDFFTKFPLTKELNTILKINDFKLCLVSPELQGYSPNQVESLKSNIFQQGIAIDAVCTKFPEIWTL
tara:strand:- start:1561 stop:2148 length:588 start_codon:yes stop_codon:yes gene_type:complete